MEKFNFLLRLEQLKIPCYCTFLLQIKKSTHDLNSFLLQSSDKISLGVRKYHLMNSQLIFCFILKGFSGSYLYLFLNTIILSKWIDLSQIIIYGKLKKKWVLKPCINNIILRFHNLNTSFSLKINTVHLQIYCQSFWFIFKLFHKMNFSEEL